MKTVCVAQKENPMRPVALLISAGYIALAGCASLWTGDLKPEKTVVTAEIPFAPRNRTTGKRSWVVPVPERLPSTDWIADFDDPVLQDLVAEALTANTDVRAAAARLQAAEASARSSRSGFYPSLDSSITASRTGFADGTVSDNTSFNIGGTVSWEADLWGRLRDTADAGDIDAEASSADYAGARLAISGMTTQTWFNLIEAKLLTGLAGRNVETQERALRLTKRRFDGGVSGSEDYRLARSAMANAQATLMLREQNEAAITRLLETLLRRYPADDLQAYDSLPVLPALSGAGTPEVLFLRRPDILAAERRMQAAGLRVDIAEKNLLPRLTLSGSTSTAGGSLVRLFSLESLFASISGRLTAPLFQGGALRAEVARNKAVLRQQLEAYADTVLTAYREVEDALDAEDLLRARERALEVSLEESRKAEERLELRFSEGLASILQLLDAQERRFNAEGQVISARKERLANRVRLHLALGGGLYGQELPREKLPKPKLAGL